jgi:phosphoribosylanthranilate isomerase
VLPPADSHPLIKVCGLTRPQDVALVAELGAWAVGFVFAPSPRRVTVDAARRLVAGIRRTPADLGRSEAARGLRPPVPLTVGVFGDGLAAEIAEVADLVGLDAVQLHGSRPDVVATRAALGGQASSVLIIQVVPIDARPPTGTRARTAAADVTAAVAAAADADLLLFDARAGGRSGGTGVSFPWEVAREAAADCPYLVAGGINPRNVGEALRISGAWGVDVSSGVELSPGIKDETLLRALFAAAGLATHPGAARQQLQERTEGSRT